MKKIIYQRGTDSKAMNHDCMDRVNTFLLLHFKTLTSKSVNRCKLLSVLRQRINKVQARRSTPVKIKITSLKLFSRNT